MGDRAGRRGRLTAAEARRRPPRPRAHPLGRRGRARRRAARSSRIRADAGAPAAVLRRALELRARRARARRARRRPRPRPPAAVARRLADVAIERGGRDDITVAVIDVDPSEEDSAMTGSPPRPTRTSSSRWGRPRSTRSSPSPRSGGARPPRRRAAEIIIIDTSGSMVSRRRKLKAAKQATRAALDALRDGTLFAVIAGSDRPARSIPRRAPRRRRPPRPARGQARRRPADGQRRHGDRELAAARRRAVRERPGRAAPRDPAHRRAEPPRDRDELAASCAPARAASSATAAAWAPTGRSPSCGGSPSALLGTVDIIAEPAEMGADFRASTERAMAAGRRRRAAAVDAAGSDGRASSSRSRPTIEDLTARAPPSTR